jgi:hypothetical protein
MGRGCVRFKSLDDLAHDVRFAGRELYDGRPRAIARWSREAGDKVLVKTVGRTVARVSAEEHMANYQAARALLSKGNSERVRERGSSAKKGAKKSAVKKAKPKK